MTISEKPILFSGPMVRAILKGQKTQTRRIMKWQPDDNGKVTVGEIGDTRGIAYVGNKTDGGHVTRVPCPYWPRAWVRENGWERPERTPKMMREGADTWERYYYDADMSEADHEEFKAWGFKRRPSIHMPRWASRITLEITGVRVERLHGISAKDIIAEGAVARAHDDQFGHNPVSAFDGKVYLDLKSLWAAGWNKINGKKPGCAWKDNPWVWIIEFRKI